MLTTYESLSFKLFSLLFGSLFSLTQTARTRSTRCFRCLSSYWNGTYKLIRFNRNLDAWSTFVFLPSAQPWWYLTPGKPCCSGTKRVTKSVSDSVPHFVLHKDLFSVRGYAGCGQLLMMKNLNIPGFLFSVGLMEFSFALLRKRKGKKKVSINQHWEGAFLLTEGVLITIGILALLSGPQRIKIYFQTGFGNSYSGKS